MRIRQIVMEESGCDRTRTSAPRCPWHPAFGSKQGHAIAAIYATTFYSLALMGFILWGLDER
ncbi:MAG: hypothetical protein U0R49_12590 [Fimbriimonadales bacterium]